MNGVQSKLPNYETIYLCELMRFGLISSSKITSMRPIMHQSDKDSRIVEVFPSVHLEVFG